jgi:hypothetical protein
MPALQEGSSVLEVAALQAPAGETRMLAFIGHQEACKKIQDVALPAPTSLGRRMASVRRATRRILWKWRLASSHRQPEMHAIDHLARHHTKVFVLLDRMF